MGGAEMALSIASAVVERVLSEVPDILCWRSADIDLHCRRILASVGKASLEHAFGNIMHRVPKDVRCRLRAAHVAAGLKYKEFRSLGLPAAEASKQTGETLLMKLMDIVTGHRFEAHDSAWCYKHGQRCPLHGPSEGHGRVRMTIVGTPCTSWSRMGSRQGWSAKTALPFAVWCAETLAAFPDLIVPECTADVDHRMLLAIFGEKYDTYAGLSLLADRHGDPSVAAEYTLMVAKDPVRLARPWMDAVPQVHGNGSCLRMRADGAHRSLCAVPRLPAVPARGSGPGAQPRRGSMAPREFTSASWCMSGRRRSAVCVPRSSST